MAKKKITTPTITHNWEVKGMTRDIETGVVQSIHWSLTSSLDTGETAYVYGEQFVVPSESFIPYEELTPEIVIGWLKPLIGADAEKINSDSLTGSSDAPVVETGLPW